MQCSNKLAPRLFYGWIIVAVSLFGISTGPGAFAMGSMGLFTHELQSEFGWTRASINLALSIVTIATAISLPIAGRFIDKLGAKRLLIISLLALATCFVAIAQVGALWQFYAVFFVMGTLAVGSNSVPYLRVLACWFDRSRGLAIGIAGSGTGLGFAYVPLLLQFVNSHYGWRWGYYCLAAIIVLITLPLILILFKERPGEVGMQPDGMVLSSHKPNAEKSAVESFGCTLRQALVNRDFWILVCTFTGLAFVVYGIIAHLVPMLVDRGISTSLAASIASAFGLSAFGGRILIGWLVDRFFARNVALVFFAISAVGVAALGADMPVWAFFLAAALVGGSLGAEIDLLAYLTTRYFGIRCFSEIFGTLFGVILITMGVSPTIFGLVYDLTHSYDSLMSIGVGLCLLAILMVWLLRPYPVWNPDLSVDTSED